MSFITYYYALSREVDGDEVLYPLVIGYEYTPFCRGARNSLGVPEEPDDHEDVEIERCNTLEGNLFELTKEEKDTIEQEILDSIRDREDC